MGVSNPPPPRSECPPSFWSALVSWSWYREARFPSRTVAPSRQYTRLRWKVALPSPATSLTCKISGTVFGVELPFNGCPKNACEHMLEGDCPVSVGEEMVYDMDIPIEPMYPTIEITGKWELFDENGEDFLCFNIPMKIEA